jgi:hypothetical protein
MNCSAQRDLDWFVGDWHISTCKLEIPGFRPCISVPIEPKVCELRVCCLCDALQGGSVIFKLPRLRYRLEAFLQAALALAMTSPGWAQAQTPGRVKISQPSGPPIPICDAAGAARDRKSPAAAGLAARCLALGGRLPDPEGGVPLTADQLAIVGATIAARDRYSALLRDQQPAGQIRYGFDIGMGAAEGQTEWGPGKQRMLDSLPRGQQEGFKVAISFSLDRNRNAELAATGAAIGDADPTVEGARLGQLGVDARAWLVS